MPLPVKKIYFLILFPLIFKPALSGGADPEPLPRKGWEKERAKHKGKGPALLISLPKDGQRVSGDRVYFSGCTEPRATLTINHKTIPLYETGAFVGSLPLKVGVNKFYFRSYGLNQNTRKIVQVIRRLRAEGEITVTRVEKEEFV